MICSMTSKLQSSHRSFRSHAYNGFNVRRKYSQIRRRDSSVASSTLTSKITQVAQTNVTNENSVNMDADQESDSAVLEVRSPVKIEEIVESFFNEPELPEICRIPEPPYIYYEHGLKPVLYDHHEDFDRMHKYGGKTLANVPNNTAELEFVFNLGPHFIQLINWDNMSKMTHSYVFYGDYKKIKYSKRNYVGKMLSMGSLRTDFVAQVNFFAHRCTCPNCFIDSYSFRWCHSDSNMKDSFRILAAVWQNFAAVCFPPDWLIQVMKNVLFFFIFEANRKAVKILDDPNFDFFVLKFVKQRIITNQLDFICNYHHSALSEWKYSKMYFLMHILFQSNEIRYEVPTRKQTKRKHDELLNNLNESNYPSIVPDINPTYSPSDRKRSKVVFPNSEYCSTNDMVTTGKERHEEIDGVNFITFETEKDMLEYTRLEASKNDRTHGKNAGLYKDKESSLILFSNQKSAKHSITPTKTNDITKIKGWRHKVFTKVSKSTKSTDRKSLESSELPKIVESAEKSIKVSEILTPTMLATENSFPRCEAPVENKEENDIDQEMNMYQDHFISLSDELNKMYSQNLAIDPILKKMNLRIKQKLGGHKSAFQSEVLDEYLEKDSKLQVSFEIPVLSASQKLKEEMPTEPVSKIQNTSTNVTIKNQESTRKMFNAQKGELKKNYVWVSGRPIRVSVYRENTKKTFYSETPTDETLNEDNFKIPLNLKSRVSKSNFQPKEKNKVISLDNSESPRSTVAHVNSSIPNKIKSMECKMYSLLGKYYKKDEQMVRTLHPPDKYFSLLSFLQSSNIGRRIPFFYRCFRHEKNINDCRRVCSKMSNNFYLRMKLALGRGRPLPDFAIQNIRSLKKDDCKIDGISAWVAASAVQSKFNSQKVTQLIVPISDQTLKNLTEIVGNNIVCRSIKSSSDHNPDIDPDVSKVVGELIDFTERSLEPSFLEYDPDVPKSTIVKSRTPKKLAVSKNCRFVREMKKLVNVSIVDVYEQTSIHSSFNCDKEYCQKGCVCISLDSKYVPLHCGKASCMFECTCSKKLFSQFNPKTDVVLTKEELSWHQTIIRKGNSDIEIMSGTEKCKREKKLPERFRSDVLLGKEMMDTTRTKPVKRTNNGSNPKKAVTEPSVSQQKHVDSPSKLSNLIVISDDENDVQADKPDVLHAKPNAFSVLKKPRTKRPTTMKKMICERRVKFFSNNIADKQTLADVFIWCAMHNKYSCLCTGWVSMLKSNILLWRPDSQNRYLANKVMFDLCLETPSTLNTEVVVFDIERYCSRTVGSLINYNVRNSSTVFKLKRKCELDKDIHVYSNSYTKMKLFFGIKKHVSYSAEPYDKNSTDYFKTCEKVWLSDQSENGVGDVDVGDETYLSKSCIVPIFIDEDVTIEAIYHTIPLKSDTRTQGHIEEIPNSQEILKKKRAAKRDNKEFIVTPITMDQYTASSTSSEKPTNHRSIIEEKRESQVDKVVSNNGARQAKTKNFTFLRPNLCSDGFPEHALLCLTYEFGYLPVLECFPEKLMVQDPLRDDLYVQFKDVDDANAWLNRFFKRYLVFADQVDLKWIIVKRGVLKLRQSRPFDKGLLYFPKLMIVSKNGQAVAVPRWKKKEESNVPPRIPPRFVANSSDMAEIIPAPSTTAFTSSSSSAAISTSSSISIDRKRKFDDSPSCSYVSLIDQNVTNKKRKILYEALHNSVKNVLQPPDNDEPAVITIIDDDHLNKLPLKKNGVCSKPKLLPVGTHSTGQSLLRRNVDTNSNPGKTVPSGLVRNYNRPSTLLSLANQQNGGVAIDKDASKEVHFKQLPVFNYVTNSACLRTLYMPKGKSILVPVKNKVNFPSASQTRIIATPQIKNMSTESQVPDQTKLTFVTKDGVVRDKFFPITVTSITSLPPS